MGRSIGIAKIISFTISSLGIIAAISGAIRAGVPRTPKATIGWEGHATGEVESMSPTPTDLPEI